MWMESFGFSLFWKLLIGLLWFRFVHFCIFACFLINLSRGDISRTVSFFRWDFHLRFWFVTRSFCKFVLWRFFTMWSGQYGWFDHLFWFLFRFHIPSSATGMMRWVFGTNRHFLFIFVFKWISFTWPLPFQWFFRLRTLSLILFIFALAFSFTLAFAIGSFFIWRCLLQKLITLLNCLVHCTSFMYFMIRFMSLSWLICSTIYEIMTLRNHLLHTLCTMNLFLVALGLYVFFYFLWFPFESRLFTAHFGLFKFLLRGKSFAFTRRSTSMMTLVVWLVDFYWLSGWVQRFWSIIESIGVTIL